MNSYTAILNDKRIEIEAKDLYSAKMKAIEILKPKKKYLGYLVVLLNCTHSTCDCGI